MPVMPPVLLGRSLLAYLVLYGVTVCVARADLARACCRASSAWNFFYQLRRRLLAVKPYAVLHQPVGIPVQDFVGRGMLAFRSLAHARMAGAPVIFGGGAASGT